MIDVGLAIRQCDCPLSAASSSYDVAFVTPHWQYHHDQGQLEVRLLVDGGSRQDLERGLEVIRGHEETRSIDLLAKQGSTARVHLSMGTTDAMRAVVDHGGYLTGPFRNVDGCERWELGFDDAPSADGAIAAIERSHDECTVRTRRSVTPRAVLDSVRARDVGSAVLESRRALTPTERRTIEQAVAAGYYEVPRAATLGTLADHLGVSDAAVSKTLRRAEAKLLEAAVDGDSGAGGSGIATVECGTDGSEAAGQCTTDESEAARWCVDDVAETAAGGCGPNELRLG